MSDFGRRPGLEKPGYQPRKLKDDNDKRFAPRRTSATPGIVTFDGAMESMACRVLDMSATGARLEFRQASGNPFLSKYDDVDRIWLVLRSDRVMYDCKITRRGETEIGVKFMAAPKAVARASR